MAESLSDDKVIRFAQRLNKLRIIPRVLTIGYGIAFLKFAYYLADWIMAYDFAALENEAVALAVIAFPTGILGVMAGVLGSIVNNYFRTGGNGPA